MTHFPFHLPDSPIADITIEPQPTCRRRIPIQQYARNGLIVPAQLQQEMAMSLNQVAEHRRAEFFRSSGDVTGPVTSKTYRFAGHTSPVAGTIIARLLVAPANGSTGTNNPRCQMAIYDTSGTQLGQGAAFFGRNAGTPNETPNEWTAATIAVDCRDFKDTHFRATLIASEEARVISCTVYEVADENTLGNGFVHQAYHVGQPILEEDRSSLQALAIALWKRGGPTLFAWSSNTDATAPSTPQAVSGGRNLVDSVALNAKAATTPAGYMVDLRHSQRETKSTVPVRFECYAGCPSGTGFVRISDEFGNTLATFTPAGAAAWQTALTADLPADLRKYYISHGGDGINTNTTYAVTCYRHDAT